MALTNSDVYSLQAPGLATVLGSGMGPLNIIRQEAARLARERALKAKAQADLEKQFTPPVPDTDGGQIFAPQVAKSANDLLTFSQKTYQDAVNGKITPNDAKTLVAAKLAEHNTTTKRAKDSQAAIDKFQATAKANNLDVSKVGGYIKMATSDPTTGQTMGINSFDPEGLTQGVTNADLLDKAGVVQGFLKGLAGKQETDYATAARLGGTGVTRSASSNIFASDAKGRVIYTLDSQGNQVPKIGNLRALEQAAMQDPQMAALLRRSLEQGQVPSATALMGISPEHLTDEERDAQLETLNGPLNPVGGQQRQSLADLIRPYGTLVTKQGETYKAPWRPRAPAAAGKLKAGQATATPTSSYGLSVSDNPTTPGVDNRGGTMGSFLGSAAVQSGQTTSAKYNFPRVGVDFATETNPHVKVKVNTRDLFVLGKGGDATRYNKNETNSLVDGKATGRHFVLEANGKRMGLPTDGSNGGTSADAFEDLKGIISRMTPAEARKAQLKSYYEVGVTGKSGTSGDGTGGKAKIIGYKDADGDYLDEEGRKAAVASGSVVTPVYDKEESQDVTLAPATAGLDAQVARQTPGYNPRQRTPQEAELIRLLEQKGGRVVDPYHTSTKREPSTTTRPDPLNFAPRPAAAPKAKTVGKNNALGF
jgi:hypothetical protein